MGAIVCGEPCFDKDFKRYVNDMYFNWAIADFTIKAFDCWIRVAAFVSGGFYEY